MTTSNTSVDLHTVRQVLTVVSAVRDIYSIGSAVIKDYDDGTKHNTVHTTSAVIGSRVGTIYGADLCVSFCSDQDALVGGIIGGIIGSICGGFLARTMAELVIPAPEAK